MKIVLIHLYGFLFPSIRNLAVYLNSKGHEAHCIFFKASAYSGHYTLPPTEKEYQLLLNKIKEINPDMIGISIFCCFFKDISKELVSRLRVFDVPIIIGGIAVTLEPDEYISNVDYLCRGEGEYTILELMNCLEKKELVKDIKGLWYKKDGKVIKNDDRRLTNLDDLPIPLTYNNTYIESDKYENLHLYKYSVSTARGCPNSCSYCANSFFRDYYSKCGKWLRKRKVESVIEELITVKNNTPELGFIHVNDDDFLYDYEWLKRFLKIYKKEINLPFKCLTTFMTCDEKRVSLIVDAGCRYLGFGIESGSEKIRKEILNRGQYTNEKVISVSKLLKKYKLLARYDIIMENPFETIKDKEEALQLLLSLETPFLLEIFSLVYFPNYPITNLALERKMIKPEDVVGGIKKEDIHDWRSDVKLMTNKEDIFYCNMYRLLDSFIPRFIIRIIGKIKLFRKYPRLLGFSRYIQSLNHLYYYYKQYK